MSSVEGGIRTRRWATKAEVAYQELRRDILDGSIPPGATIDHRTLAATIGVSTTPLREAFRRLESEGFITQVAHHEMRVSDLTLDELKDLYDVRIQLVPYAASLAAKNATDQDRERVRALADLPTEAALPTLLEQHRAFHRAIYDRCGNVVLIEMLDSLADRSGRYRLHLLGDLRTAGKPLVVHKQIADAFIERRPTELSALVEADLRTSRRQLVGILSGRGIGD